VGTQASAAPAERHSDSARAALGSAPVAPRRPDRSRGFAVAVEGLGDLECSDIRGFREAALAAVDPRATLPDRLGLVAPGSELRAFLEAWADDAAQVRRTLLISRRFDGKTIRAVATIASHGHGVETSLAVESVSAPDEDGDHEIFRSGVHRKSHIEAALARYDAEDRAACEPIDLGLIDFD
jgi:hypothetical protein